jgi:minor extracellular serine protease Vpr
VTTSHSSLLRRSIAVSAALLLVVAIPQPAAAQQADFTEAPAGAVSDDSYMIITFSDPPAASHVDEVPGHARTKPAPGERLNPQAAEVQAYTAYLRGHQQEFRDWLAQRHPQAQVVRDFQLVANAVAVEANGVSVQQLRRGPGAASVQPAGLFRPLMNTSVDLINAPALWAMVDGGQAAAGAGVNVAVLDTGIDYGHPFFGCKDTTDVVQRLYYSGEVADPALPPPPPGAPEDMWHPHGTHVAGTIAGCVAVVLGQTWSGVAPAAAVHDYNVFPARGTGYAAFGGSAFSHDIAAALEDAVADGMHALNMSLGGSQRGPNDFLDEATNATVDAGVVVVTSAGNSGPGDATVTSPASAEKAISVAASTNSQIFGVQVDVDGTDYLAAIGDFGPAEQTTGDLVDWAAAAGGDTLACAPLPAGTFDEDQIVLIERGACTFTTKVRNAENAGAGGVLMYNNVAGPPVAVIHDGTLPFPAIPAVMVSAGDGADLVSALPATATLPSAATANLVSDPGFANVIAGFSSRGPTPHGDRLKPDVTAPGVNILSAVFGAGLGFSSGTSMSSPHIAGAAAALLSLYPDWSPADVKSAIVNTADPTAVTDHLTGTEDPGVLTRGAGLADLGAAAATPVTLHPATIGFGAWQGNRVVTDEREITLRNVTGGAITCTVALTGDIVDVSHTGVSLGAGESATLVVSLDAGNHQATGSGDYDGSLSIDCGDHGSVHSPWWVRIDRSTGN